MSALTIPNIMHNYIFDVFLDGEFTKRVSTTANCYDSAEELTVELYGDEIELVKIESNLHNINF